MVPESQNIQEWEKQRPWIVCAANRYGDVIIAGARHHDSIMRQTITSIGNGEWEKGWAILNDGIEREEQGFIDQFGRFYNRKDAMHVALSNKQLEKQRCDSECENLRGTALFSEDLY